VIYFDSSFLVSLFVERDLLHGQACGIAQKLSQPMPLTLLGELELLNALNRGLGEKVLDPAGYEATLRKIADDEADGFLRRYDINQIRHYEKARQLSKRYAGQLFCRTLDVLQVAAALVLGATTFVTFDKKQARLASAAQLKAITQHSR
jgi:predicted nucleic acid-binding protein